MNIINFCHSMGRLMEFIATPTGVQRLDDLVDVAADVGVEVDPGPVRALAVDGRGDAEAEGVGGLQRIDDVEVMRPGLGEVLPGMGGRVGRDELSRQFAGARSR